MVWDDEDEYEPRAPICLYRRIRESPWLRFKRWVVAWSWMVLPVLLLAACQPTPKVGNQGGYAVVRPYCGWIEWERTARPYLHASAAGGGFAVFMWGVPLVWARAQKASRRRYILRRLGHPTLFDRIWRATVGRLVEIGIKAWQDERGGPHL